MVPEILELSLQPIAVPGRISVCAEEVLPHIVVDPMDFPAVIAKECNNFTADQTA
jgi:hypothetical protein